MVDRETSTTKDRRPCKGCLRASGTDGVDGGIIRLGPHWMVNHYSNPKERFLGWLVIQPIQHRMRMSELTAFELRDFGREAQRIENALIATYNASNPDDEIEIVYLVRLGESTLGGGAEWHLHWHLVPRTSSMKKKCEGWDILNCRAKGLKPAPSRTEVEQQMDSLRMTL